jgi:hypothetical protein
VFHQADIDEPGLAVLAVVVATLHLTAAAVAVWLGIEEPHEFGRVLAA